MTARPYLPVVRDPQDQIRRADLDLGRSVGWYAYDAAGQRVRKRVDKGGVQEERIYVAGYEVWRKRTSSRLQEERQTLQVMDDQRRIALVETLTVSGATAIATPTPRQRYQLGDHWGPRRSRLTWPGRRAVYRGTSTNLGLSEDQIVQHALEGWRFSGHTHRGG
ncbi:MAG: hypothetical protein ABMA64_37095 [Myxococcota bacterium]